MIREQLGAHHRFFVCEMGVWSRIHCKVVPSAPPDVAVITAIGMAHYERLEDTR